MNESGLGAADVYSGAEVFERARGNVALRKKISRQDVFMGMTALG